MTPYGQTFSKSAHDYHIFYAISADFDANRRKTNNFKNFIGFCCTVVIKLSCLHRYPTVA